MLIPYQIDTDIDIDTDKEKRMRERRKEWEVSPYICHHHTLFRNKWTFPDMLSTQGFPDWNGTTPSSGMGRRPESDPSASCSLKAISAMDGGKVERSCCTAGVRSGKIAGAEVGRVDAQGEGDVDEVAEGAETRSGETVEEWEGEAEPRRLACVDTVDGLESSLA